MKTLIMIVVFLGIILIVTLNGPATTGSPQPDQPAAPSAAQTDQPTRASSSQGDLIAVVANFFQAVQDILTLLADVTIQLINTTYDATPAPLRCFFGLGFVIGGLLSLTGLVAIRSGAGFMRRHF